MSQHPFQPETPRLFNSLHALLSNITLGGYIANLGPLANALSEAGAIAVGGIAGGAVGGLTSAGLSRAAGYDSDIGLAVATGAAAGLVGGAFGAQTIGMDPTAAGAVIIAGAAAGGAVSSTISGSDPGMGALFAAGGAALAIGAAYAYETNGEQAQVRLKNDQANGKVMNVEEGKILRVANSRSTVDRRSITISNDGILSFDVVTKLPRGTTINTRIELGFLPMDLTGTNAVNFRFFTSLPGSVGFGGVANFALSVTNITGPAYLRIIPDFLYGSPPVVTNFGPGQGNYIPCSPCSSNLPYTQSF